MLTTFLSSQRGKGRDGEQVVGNKAQFATAGEGNKCKNWKEVQECDNRKLVL